jgi:hypothetical protein
MSIGEIFEKFSEKYNGIYRGKIVDNIDPLMLGRCKIQVYPMFSEITEAESLPWCVPMYPIVEGSGSSIGYFAVPDIGTMVFCMFEEGDIYQGVYIGEAPDTLKGLSTSRITNYPNRKVITFSSGINLTVDDTDKTINLLHPLGAQIYINGSGEITIKGTIININPL